MRPIDVLKIRLEVGIIPRERANLESCVLWRERGVDHQQGVNGRVAGRWSEATDVAEERLKGIIAADVVRDRVGDRHILETAGRDLEIIVRVTPRP